MNPIYALSVLLLTVCTACSVNVTTLDYIIVKDNEATVLLASSGGPKGPGIRCSNPKYNGKVQSCVREVEERLWKKLNGRLLIHAIPAEATIRGQKVAREPKSGLMYRGWVTAFGPSSSSATVVAGNDGAPTCETIRWEAGRIILWQHGIKDAKEQERILNAAGLRGWA